MDNDFQVLDPTDITNVFADMAEFPVDKPVYVLEIGSPSSAINGGSESHQADFVSAMFDAWDATASEITHLEFFALTDFDPLVVEQLLDYYGLSSEAFAAYLGSLGLRTWPEAGMNKLAWNRLLSEMSARL
jgi:hypothetical protein